MKARTPLASFAVACAACGTLFAQGTHPELKPVAFSSLDANKDGRISQSEAKVDPDLYADFEMLDLNRDGFLSPQEFQAWPRALKTNASRDPTTVPGGSAGSQHMPAN